MSPAPAPILALVLAGVLAFAGFGTICATTTRHGDRFSRRPLGRGARRRLRLGGFALLAASMLPCLGTLGPGVSPGVGLATWVALLTAAALPIPLALPYLPRPRPIVSRSRTATPGRTPRR